MAPTAGAPNRAESPRLRRSPPADTFRVQMQKNQIDSAQNACLEPPQSTGLGGLIELHGNGGSSDWTWGCVAVEDNQIDQLWAVLGVNDTIVVLP